MKANELMIGDWVNLKNGKVIMPCQVTVIGHSTQDRADIGTTVCVDLSKEFPTCIFDMDVITPIPITPEILEKNGWTYNDENAKFHPNTWSGNGIMLKKEIDCFRIVVTSEYDDEDTNSTPFVLRYVSDLQHALKLRRKDKEIIL